ncbi:MAG TPA: FAD-dependent oxidoreductase [Hypericibacter adhaerens]|jgi:4-methylaminobutanoate oxidase (formaldehyde-forming)|uniref:FAD-dependent oxidoreductase n=1 Tax=Hypericibacter adhaerens TaxID=2602016 RepID=A0A5J6MYT1_9PROT|nr:FAD-dependent oxidoreductase [Hypericibacter adhaerens]QEX22942.1 FAD-dependent oxidoreductase [Hypericibacter adhaerens]HWA43565.1 FAD-dependent oxidoreductase [Hypericibacter adhaerens]
MPDSLPSHARVVVIGAGVVGSSVAYHLAAQGCKDVVLLERSKIGSGTSWHAAGNMETYRADPLIGEMIRYGVDFYPRIEAETGQALGWRRSGRVMYTCDPDRVAYFRGLPALGEARDVEIEYQTPRQVAEKLPVITDKGILAGAWIPSDGRINPTDLATAMARGAKMRGVKIIEDMPVTGMTTRNGRIASVQTAKGEIKCEAIVIASGLWSAQLGAMIGVKIPLHAVQHHYILTKPIDIVTRDLPLFISYDEFIYGREDVGGLLVGFFDKNAIPVGPGDLPRDFSFGLLDSNWNQIEANMQIALERFPVLHNAEIRTLLNGPESFTPDMQMLLGEAPAVRGCYLACGMNSSGIALSAAAGKLTAEWILEGRPSLDATKLDIRRFADSQSLVRYARARASEVVTHMCKFAAPDLDFADARGLRRSPLHAALAAEGARFVTVQQWERPIWFAREGAGGMASVSPEITAAESSVALFDRSSDAKLMLEGPRAGNLLAKLSGAAGDLPVGGAAFAPMLNPKGGVEVLAGVARLAEQRWLLLAEPEQATRLRSWIEWHRPASGTVLTDVTSGWAALALAGPHSLALANELAGRKLELNGTAQRVELGYAPVLSLPWLRWASLYLLVPTEFAADLHDRLVEAGRSLGLRHAGSLAAAALATRHGIPQFGAEASPQISVVAAGLDRLLDVEGNRGFIGRTAVIRDRKRQKGREVRSFSAAVTAPSIFASAPVLHRKRLVGFVTSGAVIPSLGKAMLMGLVDRKADPGGCQMLMQGEYYPLTPWDRTGL